MVKSEYIKLALNDRKVQQTFVDKGVIDLGIIYCTLQQLGEKHNISFADVHVDDLCKLISEEI